MTDPPKISNAEWAVMEAVWDRPGATAQEVAEDLPEKAWSPRTVKTLLGRLVKKGVLAFDVDGQRYRYRARIERDDYVRAESRSFLERVHGGDASPLLAYFLRESKLSGDELAELRRILDEKEGG